MSKSYKMTAKGSAFLDAIDCELILPNEEGHYDTAKFNRFWGMTAERFRRRRILWIQTILSLSALIISISSLVTKLVAK